MLDLSLPTWVADAHSKGATSMDRYYGFGEVSTGGRFRGSTDCGCGTPQRRPDAHARRGRKRRRREG